MKNHIDFKFILLGAALAFGVGSLQAFAFGTADDVDQNAYTSSFKDLDTDHNGTLSKSEASKEELFAKHFVVADKNHDGMLDQDEYTSYRSAHEKKVTSRVASDSWITSKVKASLLKDEGMKSLKVSVKTHNGVVLLSGFVDSQDQIKQAEKIAAGIAGVKSVKNSLVLKKNS